MWKFTFCPRFQFCSAIFFICLIELAFFIASLIHTCVTTGQLDPHFFLGINIFTLQKFGMRMPWLIYENGQVHRFIVPTFLHFGFSHIVITTLLQLSLGTVIESFMGTGRFIVYYTLVCIGSNIFGALCSSKYAIGSDPVIFGFLATLFSVMLVYWERIPGTNCTKVCQTLMMVMVFILVAMLLTTSAQQYSSYTSRV